MLKTNDAPSAHVPKTGQNDAKPCGYLIPRQDTSVRSVSKTLRGEGGALRLTDRVARTAAPGANRVIWDRDLPGFGLRLRASGARSWIVQYRRRGRLAKATLGTPGQMGAEEARKQARALLKEAALDGLPKPRRRPVPAPSFADYVPVFWHDYARHWKASTAKRNRYAIDRELIPAFGALRLDAIARADVLRWRDDLAARPAIFNRAVPVLSAMLAHAEQLGLRSKGSNPARGCPRYKRQLPERFLRAHEYRALWGVLGEAQAEFPQAAAIIRLLLLTGARRSEISELQWAWVQPLRLKLPDSKTGPKTVFLNSPAMAVLSAIEPVEGCPFVFPDRTGTRPFPSLGQQWELIRNRAGLPDVRLHDLRHSFASVAINAGVSLPLIGGLLGHALPETTERYAHLQDETVAEAANRVCGTVARYLEAAR